MFWEYATQTFVNNFLFNWELLSKHKSILENNHMILLLFYVYLFALAKQLFMIYNNLALV